MAVPAQQHVRPLEQRVGRSPAEPHRDDLAAIDGREREARGLGVQRDLLVVRRGGKREGACDKHADENAETPEPHHRERKTSPENFKSAVRELSSVAVV
jgi:hypothetical protein